ncbi:30S ribosomal protein S6e [Candidatus Gugararchaeum adminiculabundum]|nr:30S ribosomal protein S6e [Candidatus Gugararchaeum adminiculabundum]
MKVVISDPKEGKSYQVEVGKDKANKLLGVKIGEALDGGIVGASGYKLIVTGGTDSDGIPMRGDVQGNLKVAPLLQYGMGQRKSGKGVRYRKSLRGNTIGTVTQQINTKVTDYGDKPLAELFPPSAKKDTDKKKK